MNKLNRELGKMAVVAVPMVLQPLLNFGFLILVARLAPLADYGALALAMVLLTMVVGFSDLGLRDFLLGKTGIDRGLSSGENLFLPACLGYLLLCGALLAYLGFVAGTPQALWLFVALLPEAFALGVLNRCLFFHYQKRNELVRFSSRDAFYKSLPFAVKIALFWATGDLLLSVALGSLVALLAYAFWFYRECIRVPSFFARDRGLFAGLGRVFAAWRLWLPFTVSFLSFFLYFGADRVLIEALLGAEPLALYAAAYSFIAVGQIAVTAFWSLYMPKISRGEDVFGQRRFLALAAGLSLLMFVAYQVFAFNFFTWFYPEGYAGAVTILAVLSGFFIFRLVNVVFEMYWVAQERYAAFVKMRVACGLFAVVMNLLFLPLYGLLAAAVVIVAAEALLSLFILAAERRWRSARAVGQPQFGNG